MRETFTVRKQSFGVGVERTFPLHSPKIERIEVMAIGDVRRAKLYYLREKVGKKARVREKQQRPGAVAHRRVVEVEPATEDAPAATEADDLEPERTIAAAEALGGWTKRPVESDDEAAVDEEPQPAETTSSSAAARPADVRHTRRATSCR